jgi:ATP-dependent DNA ligase
MRINHDGYRIIVLRDASTVRLYSRNANDWSARLSALAAAAARIEAKSFMADGEAFVLGTDGLSLFDELRRTGARAATHAPIRTSTNQGDQGTAHVRGASLRSARL